MLLLFKPAVTLPAASLGIALGLSGMGSGVAATLTTNIGLTAPTSIELRVSAIQDIHLGLTGISAGFLTRNATLTSQIGIIAAGGFGGTATHALLMGLSGTVGSFLDGDATVDIQCGLSGATAPSISATPGIKFDLGGLPNLSGGTVTPTSTAGMAFGLSGTGWFVDQANADVSIDVNGIPAIVGPPPVTIASMQLNFESDSMRMFFRKK